MATKAEKIAELKASGAWKDVQDPVCTHDGSSEVPATPYKEYAFVGLRLGRTVQAGEIWERVAVTMHVFKEGTGEEDAQWKGENPVAEGGTYRIIQAIEAKIADPGDDTLGIVEDSLASNGYFLTATFTALDDDGSGGVLRVEYALTFNRTTDLPEFRKIG